MIVHQSDLFIIGVSTPAVAYFRPPISVPNGRMQLQYPQIRLARLHPLIFQGVLARQYYVYNYRTYRELCGTNLHDTAKHLLVRMSKCVPKHKMMFVVQQELKFSLLLFNIGF